MAASAAETVQDAHVVITMPPTADVVNSVIFAGGVAQALADGAVWAQMGTIGLTATTEIGSRLGQLRPVVTFAHPGVRPAAVAAVRPVFSAIGAVRDWPECSDVRGRLCRNRM
jgi:5,10-methenyltetrahydromethanopterin hydrogenase